eukprot:gene2580-3542_t
MSEPDVSNSEVIETKDILSLDAIELPPRSPAIDPKLLPSAGVELIGIPQIGSEEDLSELSDRSTTPKSSLDYDRPRPAQEVKELLSGTPKKTKTYKKLTDSSSSDLIRYMLKNYGEVKIMPHLLQRKENFRKVKKDYSNFKSEILLHSAIFLFFISLMRVGPTLMYGENLHLAYYLDMKMFYGWNDFQFYSTLPFLVGSSFAFLLFFLFRLISFPFLVALSNHIESKPTKFLQVFVNFLKDPYYICILSLCLMTGFQLGVIYSIQYPSPIALIILRGLFGFFDGIHRYHTVYFVAKIFSNQNFCLAVGFITSVETLVTASLTLVKTYITANYYLWGCFFACIFSTIVSASLKTLDTKDFNLFGANFEEEFLIISRLKHKTQLVAIIVVFSIFHLSLQFCNFVGLNIFPLNFGGYGIWFSKMNINPFSSDLFVLIFTAYLIKAMMIPLIGTLLDTEYDTFEVKHSNIVEIIQKHTIHFRTIFIGILGTAISQVLYYFTEVEPRTHYYYGLMVLYSLCSSSLQISLISFPMIIIRNMVPQMFATYYSMYSGLYLLTKDVSRILHIFVIDNEIAVQVFMSTTIAYILIILVFIVVVWVVSYGVKRYRKSKVQKFKIIESEDTAGENSRRHSHVGTLNFPVGDIVGQYWRLIYILPMEIISLCVTSLGAFLLFGAVNFSMIYFYGYRDTNLIFLPILFIMFLISIFFSFSAPARKLFSKTFFKKTRKILGILKKVTIGKKITENFRYSIAIWTLKTGAPYKLEALSKADDTDFLTFIVPDSIVLRNEDDRIKIFELIEDVKLDRVTNKQHCSNGVLITNDSERRNIFNFQSRMNDFVVLRKLKGRFFDSNWFKQNFYFVMYGGYIMVFALPVFINIFYCIEDCKLPLFSNSANATSVIVNFFCGFFLMYPFVNAWKEVFLIIEQLSNQAIILKKLTGEIFGDLSNFTIEKIEEWDKIMLHVNNLIFVRATYIKYTFIIAWSSSKFSSILFGIFALFLKTKITTLFISLVFLVVLLEIAVIFYLVLPASMTTMEMTATVIAALDIEREFTSKILFNDQYTDEEKIKIEKALRLMNSKCKYWQAQAQLGYIGYWFRLESIHTSWGIGPGDVRSSIMAFLFTLTPSLITFFLNNT